MLEMQELLRSFDDVVIKESIRRQGMAGDYKFFDATHEKPTEYLRLIREFADWRSRRVIAWSVENLTATNENRLSK
jgi:hypothetical protein